VGKGAPATCPPSITDRASNMVGTLPPSLVELRRDKSLCPPTIYDLWKERRASLASKSAAPEGGSTATAEAQYAPFIGAQLNCGCCGGPCMVSAGAGAAVLANGAGAIVLDRGLGPRFHRATLGQDALRIHSSAVIAGSSEQHRLRPIDAGDRNELPAISRDPNVIGGRCNALCARHASGP